MFVTSVHVCFGIRSSPRASFKWRRHYTIVWVMRRQCRLRPNMYHKFIATTEFKHFVYIKDRSVLYRVNLHTLLVIKVTISQIKNRVIYIKPKKQQAAIRQNGEKISILKPIKPLKSFRGCLERNGVRKKPLSNTRNLLPLFNLLVQHTQTNVIGESGYLVLGKFCCCSRTYLMVNNNLDEQIGQHGHEKLFATFQFCITTS